MLRTATPPTFDRSWTALKNLLHLKLVNSIDLSRFGRLTEPAIIRREVRLVVERLVDDENVLINRMERERLIDEILDDTFGFGALEILFHDVKVREIRVEGPDKIVVRRGESFEPADTAFQLYLICGRLLSAAEGILVEPSTACLLERDVPADFRMTARFPATRLESPLLHFRRFSEPAPAAEVPVPTLPRREQQLLIRFLKALHEAGIANLRQLDELALRRSAEQVVVEFFMEENQQLTSEERARLVETILHEAKRE